VAGGAKLAERALTRNLTVWTQGLGGGELCGCAHRPYRRYSIHLIHLVSSHGQTPDAAQERAGGANRRFECGCVQASFWMWRWKHTVARTTIRISTRETIAGTLRCRLRLSCWCARGGGDSLGGAKSSLGDAESSVGDAKSSLGDAKSSVGDAESSVGDA
jgi:hypothetical protein